MRDRRASASRIPLTQQGDGTMIKITWSTSNQEQASQSCAIITADIPCFMSLRKKTWGKPALIAMMEQMSSPHSATIILGAGAGISREILEIQTLGFGSKGPRMHSFPLMTCDQGGSRPRRFRKRGMWIQMSSFTTHYMSTVKRWAQ